jgi:cytochrome c peroxidase
MPSRATEALGHEALLGRAVIRHYERGGLQRGPHTSSLLAGFRLSSQERRDLIAFLESLTDSNITTNPRFSNPFAVGQAGQ